MLWPASVPKESAGTERRPEEDEHASYVVVVCAVAGGSVLLAALLLLLMILHRARAKRRGDATDKVLPSSLLFSSRHVCCLTT